MIPSTDHLTQQSLVSSFFFYIKRDRYLFCIGLERDAAKIDLSDAAAICQVAFLEDA